jgi:hypothetical protein
MRATPFGGPLDIKTLVRTVIFATLGILCWVPAAADPLGVIRVTGGVGVGVRPWLPPVDQQAFSLVYDDDGRDHWSGMPCLGCDLLLPLGFTGTVDFNAGTDGENFSRFVEMLTDGEARLLYVLGGLAGGGAVNAGGGQAQTDFNWFGGTQSALALQTWTIDYIRLNVLINDITPYPDGGFANTYTLEWVFDGTGTSLMPPPDGPARVPEPATALYLISAGLLGLISRAKRFRQT